jgi:hypothetical protein
VAHTYDPSYSGDRDQKEHGLQPDGANSLSDTILKKPFTKRTGGVNQGVGPELKPQYCQKKKMNQEHAFFPPKFVQTTYKSYKINIYSQ